MAGHGVIVRSI